HGLLSPFEWWCRNFILPDICKPCLFVFLRNLFYLTRSFCCSFFPNRSRLRWVAIWYAALQTVLIDLHLFRQHMTFIENAAVKTAAFSRLTTEIPQTDFCFNYLTGTPFQECPSFLFVPIQFSASQLISLEVAAISQTVAFSA
ncbi:hypothetical protein, partial [Flavonifractor plautii]|uniref:hypothetical protein n=1 Tax=Flavonifractor plautii TaxID=292800 RepID=UPI001A9A7E7F